MKKEEFFLSGLRCPSCARLIQDDVLRLDGVEGAVVDLAAQKLHLDYDEQSFQFEKLEAAVKAAGFGVSRA
ncbi:MAG: heavy-metal-associated domain-containing protein [Deltaproteobacteria bacterium]|jgi:Cu+-exporting ATPase|nr:heavy-metal-associated domain-containing protein [Deltaproteobacteria bacterium]